MMWIRFAGTHQEYDKLTRPKFDDHEPEAFLMTMKDYQQALDRLEVFFDAKKGTSQGDELEILGILMGQHENEHSSIDMPDPIEAIKKILSGKRKLSLDMIRQLPQKLNIPGDVLIQAY